MKVADAAVDSIGICDSPFSHDIEWERNLLFYPNFPELVGSEYQALPRGRIVYKRKDNQFRIYADKTILANQTNKELVAAKFDIMQYRLLWFADLHYRTF